MIEKREWQIPFNKPSFLGNEQTYIAEAIANGHISGDGIFTRKCHRLLEEILKVPKVFLTTSCTDALEMAALLLEIQPGDEVIVPSFTFISTANAFVLFGARPVFVDIRADTLNLDESKLESAITPSTKVITTVHYGGVGCEMNDILEIGNRHGLPVVEDNAHGLFGKYRGEYLGTLGCFATQSFHETKNLICGEGGALLINDPEYIDRAEVLREKGSNRSRFFRGEVDRYTWVDSRSSYLPSDLLAAFLYAQLEARERVQSRRQQIWQCYYDQLKDWGKEHDVSLPVVPEYCDQSYHLFFLIMPSYQQRQQLIEHLKSRGILSVFHYLPLHLSPMGRKFGGKEGDCPVAEDLSDRLIRLPFYNTLTEAEQERVIKEVLDFDFR